ncbi:protein NRT1/ PTR FAMILY 5.10-like [Papaver somniferum]|nr:protein NRT1/ PTR FAMILY 5.10-like [Papaver somniferum]
MATTAAGHDDEPLPDTIYVQGMVNFHGEKINHNGGFGGWKSVVRVITVGSIDSFIFYGMASNLISLLTTKLGQSTATAAVNINAWSGFVYLLPLLTSFVADSYLGRFRTILFSLLIYISGLVLLTLYTSLQSASCSKNAKYIISCSSPSTLQLFFCFSSLYLVGIGIAVCKTCAPAFGADQFDELNPGESKSKSSFFNWWQIGLSVGASSSHLVLNYIQDNLGWGLAFGISCITMVTTLIVFLSGTKSYRYILKSDHKEKKETLSNIFKVILPLLPLWIICLMYTVVDAQNVTFFTKQGSTMDRTTGQPDFKIPAAAVQSLIGLSIILFTTLYDRAFVPFAQAFTGKPNGITTLQRIGGGIVISAISMVIAAIVEHRRLRIALESGLIADKTATIPMAVWWLVPQYVLSGLAIVFTSVGLLEFFYDEVPNELRSVGLSLYSTIFGVGSLLSGLLISVIQKATSAGGEYGWFANNINQGHLDYFYWLLAGLDLVGFVAFLCFSKFYVYKRKAPM